VDLSRLIHPGQVHQRCLELRARRGRVEQPACDVQRHTLPRQQQGEHRSAWSATHDAAVDAAFCLAFEFGLHAVQTRRGMLAGS
jgi:hypothetical protein